MRVVSAAQMRAMDRRTVEEYHVPGVVLMENAALRVVEVVAQRFAPLAGKRIDVFCGKGNNGGDGLAIARHLAVRFGADVTIRLLAAPEQFSGDAHANWQMAQAFGLKVVPIVDDSPPPPELGAGGRPAELIIDALFGTGIHGGVTGAAADVIQSINDSGRPVVAVDIPSGLDADTGKVEGACIKADLTGTFALPKYGLLDYPGAAYVGELIVADIGMPRAVTDDRSVNVFLTEPADVARWLPPRQENLDSNKGHFGHVTVFAGSACFAGAPILTAEAAARTGAGLVTLAVPEGIHSAVMAHVSPVVMTRGLPQTGPGTFGKAAIEPALAQAAQGNAAAIGPGLGADNAEIREFVREFVARCPVPLVIDADALNCLSQEPDCGASVVKRRPRPRHSLPPGTVLTPHPGEMGRLLSIETKAVQADRRAAVEEAARNHKCVVLLKGARTLIAAPDGSLHINTTGNPGMATGGAGDVLTGIIAALLAQHLGPQEAAACGAYIHGLAGDLVAQARQGETGMIAPDLIDYLPRAIAICQGETS